MPRPGTFFSRRDCRSDDGFTLIEVLVSLLILSIIGLVVWRGSILATRVLSTSTESSMATTKILQLDDSLRREIEKIQMPFWLREIKIEQTEHGITLPYYQGDPDNSLTIAAAGNYLDVSNSSREQAFRLGPFPGLRVETAYDAQTNPIGVRVQIAPAGNRLSQEGLFFRFGSSPLWVDDEDR
ncbi:MAG: prepilin-type N-terminal cleavage/methylation domain-containing protein [Spirochaetales bacterium]|nr:prepilin-type N-terminal cleavage/methylation domain-containing protein [Spirochaetales bacterium]